MQTPNIGRLSLMNKPLIIGIGSIARVGKDLMADLLMKKFASEGYNVKKYALAYELKKDCEEFLKEKLGLDVWSNDTEVKSKFREFLVWYGKVKRQETQGTYWTGLLQERIMRDHKEYEMLGKKFTAIVTDIRYCDPKYPKDEVYWLKRTMNGVLINLDRKLPNGAFVTPANKDEEENSARVRCASTVEWIWETSDSIETLNNEYVYPLYDFIIRKTK